MQALLGARISRHAGRMLLLVAAWPAAWVAKAQLERYRDVAAPCSGVSAGVTLSLRTQQHEGIPLRRCDNATENKSTWSPAMHSCFPVDDQRILWQDSVRFGLDVPVCIWLGDVISACTGMYSITSSQ